MLTVSDVYTMTCLYPVTSKISSAYRWFRLNNVRALSVLSILVDLQAAFGAHHLSYRSVINQMRAGC